MNTDTETLRHTITLDVDIPVDWIDYLTRDTPYYCGYWMRGVKHDEKLGWLCWEHGGDYAPGTAPDQEAALLAWRASRPLPKGWHRLDRDAAIRAYVEGVKRWGVNWMKGEHNDDPGYDVVVQLALLGEVRYG